MLEPYKNLLLLAHLPSPDSTPQHFLTEATPIATTPSQHLTPSFFCRPAEEVAPELIGCLLVKRQPTGEMLRGVIVETEAYSQDDPACHGYRRRTSSNETLELPQFGGQVSGLHGGECTGSDELLFVFDWAEVANR